MTKRLVLIYCLIISILIMATYGQVYQHEFINLDDDLYITANEYVQQGLTKESIVWAFTKFHSGHWHPLTWLSLMLDVEIFGISSGKMALMNVLFHVLNSLGVFFIFGYSTRRLHLSALIALIFAIHPLHVESVAWITERKDVLSSLFMIITIMLYLWYVKNPKGSRLVLTTISFTLGLLAKPMIVTLPALLVLLDIWPLQRIAITDSIFLIRWSELQRSIKEKWPLWFAVGIFSGVVIVAQKAAGALQDPSIVPWGERFANTTVAYISYIGLAIWPKNLGCFYPAAPIISGLGLGAFIGLIAVSYLVYRHARKKPFMLVGWLWFLISLTPVIGIIQVGGQARADRFMYMPLIGLIIMLVFGLQESKRWQNQNQLLRIGVCSLWLLGLTIATYVQVGYWQNSITLFTHTIKVTRSNYLAHTNLGSALLKQGKAQEARWHYEEAARYNPTYPEAQINLGSFYARNRDFVKASWHFHRALAIRPNFIEGWFNLGTLQTESGEYEQAITSFQKVLQLNPHHVAANFRLGDLYERKHEYAQAISYFSKVTQLLPKYQEAYTRLEKVRMKAIKK